MVDRLVPVTSLRDIDRTADYLGLADQATVKTEPFCQWVIQDRFAGAKPDFEAAGVHLAGDVRPWETAKLRLLNGAHSAIAYLGGLMGIEHVDEFVSMPLGEQFIQCLWRESGTTFRPPAGFDREDYCRALMQRFKNSALAHRTRQIAMDGSQKLPQRLCAPIEARLTKGQSIDSLALAVAAWIRWQAGIDDQRRGFRVEDPLAAKIERLLRGLAHPADRVDAILTLKEVFSDFLRESEIFRNCLVDHLDCLATGGERAALQRLLDVKASVNGVSPVTRISLLRAPHSLLRSKAHASRRQLPSARHDRRMSENLVPIHMISWGDTFCLPLGASRSQLAFGFGDP
jgi:fructuronate reductase